MILTMNQTRLLSFVLAAFLPLTIWAQKEKPPVSVDLPFLELPFNSSRYFPDYFSMRQSLAFSTDFYENMHYLLGGPPENHKTFPSILAVAGFDMLSFYVPLGNGWMHEEWHRAVMTNRKIGSFNDINTFPIGRNLIAVSHVDDADLIRLKRDQPADQVRLSSAGMESEVHQNLLIEKHHFFDKSKSLDHILLWVNAINVSGYMSTCASGQADTSTDDQNKDDGADLSKRDFTGLDCTAWAYDLFRPDEPYTARGTHPSGIGINRYIHFSDLNQKEQDFLHRQAALSFLNFADPFLWGRPEFHSQWMDQEVRWNFKFSHYITSFGGVIDTSLFLETQENQFLMTWHHGMTDTRYFPGLSVEWLEKALPWSSFYLTTGITVWQQPRDQRVEETKGETLLDGTMTLSYHHTPRFSSYLGLEAKTPGWLAGNVYLDRNFSTWAGIKANVF